MMDMEQQNKDELGLSYMTPQQGEPQKKREVKTYAQWMKEFGLQTEKGEPLFTREQFIMQAKKDRIGGIFKSITSAGGSVGKAVFNRIGENFNQGIEGFGADGGGIIGEQIRGISSAGVRKRILAEEDEPLNKSKNKHIKKKRTRR